MSKKRAPKTAAQRSDADASNDQTSLSDVVNTASNAAFGEDAPDSAEGKKGKRDKKNKAAKAAKAPKGDKPEKREKKAKRDKKHKKEKATKVAKASKQDRETKRDKSRGKKHESKPAPELRPLRKVNVQLIEPNGQPYAHFDGEIGVLELMLPKKAEGDSVV